MLIFLLKSLKIYDRCGICPQTPLPPYSIPVKILQIKVLFSQVKL